ncbi:MAG: family 78 glycoside hydrolase catalytic domain [Nocardioides sp.]|uniref:family 78 glycoside hydrolase catalytic domain n=1 Tax=Nocardioides sp. TaxID=35761 RepID=UPI0039E69512
MKRARLCLATLLTGACLVSTGLASGSTYAAIPAAAVVSTATLSTAATSIDGPTGLSTDGLTTPADLEDDTPTFAWHAPDIAAQSAYRIVVSSTAAKAAAHEGDVWDSGEIASAEQGQIAYAGSKLATSQRYYWSVRVWDEDGTASDWSSVTWFGTGPGSSWDATPIWSQSPTELWTDYTLTAKLTVTAVAVGIRFRSPDANNGYMWQFRGADNQLVPHVKVGGTYTTLGDAVTLPDGTLAIGQQVTIAIDVDGDIITTSIDGIQVDQRTDDTFSSGIVGVRTGRTETGTLDDLSVVPDDSDDSDETLLSSDFSDTNVFGCGTVADGVLSIPISSDCLATGLTNDWAFFRKDIDVEDKPIAWASAYATADAWKSSKQYVYKLSVDGTFVGLGPTAPTGEETRYDGFDITDLLAPGKTSTVSAIAHSTSSTARFLAMVVIAYTDGTTQVVGTGSDWRAQAGSSVYRSPGSYGTGYFTAPRENTDARAYPDGFDEPGYDDSGWPAAVEQDAFEDLEAAPMGKVTEQSEKAASITEIADGDYVVDFGRTWLGGTSYDITDGTAGSQVQLRYGQVLNDDGTVKYQTNAGNTYLDTYTLADGASHVDTFGMRTFRYVEIVGAPEAVTADNLEAEALIYPFDEDASTFDSSDDDLNQVYALAKNTIEATNQNFYTDSYERERTDYEADAYLQLMSSLYLMDDLSLGRYSMNYFKSNRTWPTEWPVYVILAVHDAWEQTGNTEQVADYYTDLQSKLPTSTWLDTETGLIEKTSGSNGCSSSTDCDIVDWPTSERDGYVFEPYNTVVNSLTYRALQDMSEMARAIGEDGDATTYADQATTMRTAINSYLYDSDTGAYDDGMTADHTLSGHESVHASAFALAFGVPTAETASKVADYVASRGLGSDGLTCSVYCAAFLIEGLYSGDDGQAALDALTAEGTSSWMNMIADGAGATAEAWDSSLKSNLTYSHPWAASPAFNVPSGLFGIQPETAGYETVSIKPQPGDLDWAHISTPTVRGEVGTGFDHGSDDALRVVASIPGNTTATVSVPTSATEATTVYVDGAARTVTPEDGYLTVDDLGAGCHLVTTSTDTELSEHLTSVCTPATDTASAPSNTTAPRITGAAIAGRTLRVGHGTWRSDGGLSYSFRWLRDGRPIGSATAARYTLRAADVGRRIAVRVTATSTGGESAVADSAYTAKVAKAASRVRVTAAPKRVHRGARVRVRIRVGATGLTATGTVRITRPGSTPVTRRLVKGVATVTFRARGSGKKKVRVVYSGSASVTRSTGSATVVVRR